MLCSNASARSNIENVLLNGLELWRMNNMLRNHAPFIDFLLLCEFSEVNFELPIYATGDHDLRVFRSWLLVFVEKIGESGPDITLHT